MYNISVKYLIIIFAVISLFFGCAHVVSEDLRDKAEEGIPLSVIFSDPDKYKGKVVVLAGTVISSINKQEGTYIEVFERPLEHQGIQEYTDETHGSLGRFFILLEGYGDTAVFYKDRKIIVAGEVMGKMVNPPAVADSNYLLVRSKELHLKPEDGSPIGFGLDVWDSF